MDGSPASAPRVELEGVSEPAVMTKVSARQTLAKSAGSRAASCVRAHTVPSSERAGIVAVERVGVESSTITFAWADGLHGCDNARGAREASRAWCGIVFGVLTRGRLDDPRLDVAGCRTVSGDPVAFVWVSAGPRTRYVAVAQDGYAEVYKPAGDRPIRIATTAGIEGDGSRVTFRISEHDARGRLVSRYALDAVPEG